MGINWSRNICGVDTTETIDTVKKKKTDLKKKSSWISFNLWIAAILSEYAQFLLMFIVVRVFLGLWVHKVIKGTILVAVLVSLHSLSSLFFPRGFKYKGGNRYLLNQLTNLKKNN